MALHIGDTDTSHLTEESLTAQFDNLVAQKIIRYAECQSPIYHRHNDLTFEIIIAEVLKTKPGMDVQAFNSAQPTATQPRADQNSNSTLRPGSDIDTTGYEIGPIGPAHFLAFNKFCIYRPQMLILTTDGFRRQSEPLDRADLAVARDMLARLRGDYLVLFNCGVASACSRVHKHLQVIPCDPNVGSPERPFALWPDELDRKAESKGAGQVPFQYRVTFFPEPGEVPATERLAEIYQSHIFELGIAAGSEGKAAGAHNVVIGRRWIVTIPRRHAGFDGMEPNAAGMLGMIWVSSGEKAKKWMDAGPADVLAYGGVPPAGELARE